MLRASEFSGLLQLDVGLLHDALVGGDLAADEAGKLLGLQRPRADAELAELLDHLGIPHDARDLGVELLHHRGGVGAACRARDGGGVSGCCPPAGSPGEEVTIQGTYFDQMVPQFLGGIVPATL